MNMHSWADHALHAVNSAANVIAIIAGTLILISLALVYFTGTELTARANGNPGAAHDQRKWFWIPKAKADLKPVRQAEKEKASRFVQFKTEVAAARPASAEPGRGEQSEKATAARITQVERELAAARDSEKTKASRITQVEAELATARQSEKANTARASQIAAELAAAQRSDEAKTKRITQVEMELAAAQQSEKAKAASITQVEAELASVQRSEKEKASRLMQVEAELAATHSSEEAKATRIAEMEKELAAAKRSEEAKGSRVTEVEAELSTVRRSAEEAKALAKKVEANHGPRKITQEQRSQFLNAVRGQPTGKIIVSAFFDNKETHDFGAEILNLLNEAGFDVIKRTPLNFFTTARPSSGVRVGCENITDPPSHFSTLQKGLSAMGLQTPTTNITNTAEEDVVEVQVTPR